MATKKIQIIGSLGSNIEVDTTLTESGQAADAKAVGDKLTEFDNAVAQKAQVQIITWGADD